MDEGVIGTAAKERAIAEVEAELARLCELLAEGRAMGLDEGREMVGGAMSESIAEFRADVRAAFALGRRDLIALPLLVHAAESGRAPCPARPVAVIHLLWWAAARHLDDLTAAPSPTGAGAGQKALTALALGGHLPARLVAALPASGEVRAALAGELSRAWLDAVDGRLRDLTGRPELATRESVLRGYEGRTGAPYAMAAASAACIAGAGGDRVAGWRDFGRALGVVRRLGDDERDLASGRHDGLARGTAIYRLVHLLETLPAKRRREALALHAAARRRRSARAELAMRLLDDDVMDAYAASVRALVGRAHRLADRMGGEPGRVRELHGLVDGTARHLPGLRPAAA